MKLTYHRLEITGTKTISRKLFISMGQKIDCSTQQGLDYQEVRLFGFTPGDSSIIRTLLYECPSDITLEEFGEILTSYPNARIIRSISHELILTVTEREFTKAGILSTEGIARRQLVRDGNYIYIDRYGMAVYTQNKLSLIGEYQDQDLRIPITIASIAGPKSTIDVPIYTTNNNNDDD